MREYHFQEKFFIVAKWKSLKYIPFFHLLLSSGTLYPFFIVNSDSYIPEGISNFSSPFGCMNSANVSREILLPAI